jgi:hypothetical protein
MIPPAQFDPATLTIWTSTAPFTEPEASLAAGALRGALRGHDPSDILGGVSSSDPLRGRLIWLASCAWHEKRHFFDTCLTNYGARRFRDLWSLAANFFSVAADAMKSGAPVWFPVDVYANPVRRSVLGIAEPHSSVVEIARMAQAMKRFSKQLDAPWGYGDTAIHLGGEAQLEGLAQASQTLSVEFAFGFEDSAALTAQHVLPLPPEGPYRAIESVSGRLGCIKEYGDVLVLNVGLAAALFVTALCGRFYGAGSKPDAVLVAPQSRLAHMIEELGWDAGRFDMSDDDAAELVDGVARRLWGRTAVEEIAEDIDAMEAMLARPSASWMDDESLRGAFADFVSMRRAFLRAALELGPASLLPRAFPVVWRNRLNPWHVVATPHGGEQDDEGSIVFGRQLNLPAPFDRIFGSTVIWGKLYMQQVATGEQSLGPTNQAAWIEMLERHGPRALLMLNGRRHRRMVPPELERPIDEIQNEIGIPVRFDPHYEWPEQRDQATRTAEAVTLAAVADRSTFMCDVTGDQIHPSQAAVLTPWEFRRSSLEERFRQGGIYHEIQLARDWSDWVVRSDLLD